MDGPASPAPVAKYSLESLPDQKGKVAIVTGGNSGIGFEVASGLLAKGARVIVASRSEARVKQAVLDLQRLHPKAQVEGASLDLASFKSIRQFVTWFKAQGLPLHLLVNNAGMFVPPFSRTAEGMEVQLGVNHFSTWYLTDLLLPVLKASGPSRVVFVNSGSAEMTPQQVNWNDLVGKTAKASDMDYYGLSKQYNLMLSKALAEELKGSGVSVVSVNPGLVNSGIQTKSSGCMPQVFLIITKMIGQTTKQGALHVLYGTTEPSLTTGALNFAALTPLKMNKMSGPTGPWTTKHKAILDLEQCRRMLAETRRIVAESDAVKGAVAAK